MRIFKKIAGTILNQFRITPTSTVGAPTFGVHQKGEEHVDVNGERFVCIEDGSPGLWVLVEAGIPVIGIHPLVGPLIVIDNNGKQVRVLS